MTSKYPTQPLQKIRFVYKQAQNEINNNQLNRFTQDRMKKRYSYIAKQVQKKQQANDKQNIQQLIFYRNKFHSLLVLVQQSMRESYNKNKVETEVKNILKDNWENSNFKNITFAHNKQSKTQVINDTQPNQQNHFGKTTSEYIDNNKMYTNAPVNQQAKSLIKRNASKTPNNRSLSPLESFFEDKQQQIQRTKRVMNFKSVVPKSELQNSKLLHQMKSMNKKINSNSTHRDVSRQKSYKEDSRLRDLQRQNEQLNRIIRKRQHQQGVIESKQTVSQLQKQVYYYQKANKQLKEQTGYRNNNLIQRNESPYSINYLKNNVNEISSRNQQYNHSRRAIGLMQRSKSKSYNKSQTYIQNSRGNDSRSNRSNTSSVVQKQKQVYINSTPQILFENELIKVLVVRFPIKIHQKNISSTQKLNPQDFNPNEERLQIMILNNASKYVKNEQLFVKLTYDYDSKYHEIKSFKKPNQGYSKIADTSRDIVYRQIIKIKLLSRQGYNQQIKALIKSQFYYNADSRKKKIFDKSIHDKKSDNFSIEIKLPVTFIEFSSKPFSARDFHNKKTKLTIKPNPLYDTLQHTYMNTNLPFLKSSNPRVLKQHATLYGRSFVHDSNGKGTYLENQIELSWFQKKNMRYISIQTIQEWVYLLAYIFLDVQEEEQQFEKQFRKPSMHVFFNVEDKQFV